MLLPFALLDELDTIPITIQSGHLGIVFVLEKDSIDSSEDLSTVKCSLIEFSLGRFPTAENSIALVPKAGNLHHTRRFIGLGSSRPGAGPMVARQTDSKCQSLLDRDQIPDETGKLGTAAVAFIPSTRFPNELGVWDGYIDNGDPVHHASSLFQ